MKLHVSAVATVLLCCCGVALLAQNTSTEKKNGFLVPDGKTAPELVESVKTQLEANKPKQGSSKDEITAFISEASIFLRDMGDKIIALKPESAVLQDAYMMKFQGLEHMANENDPKDVKNVENLLDEIDRVLPDTQLAKLVRAMDLERKATVFAEKEPTEKNFLQIKNEVKKLIAQKPVDFLPHLALMFLEVAKLAEEKLDKKNLVAEACTELLAELNATDNEALKPIANRIEATQRRLNLLGQEINIEGITLDGKKFDVKSLRGKVVLIDFFASWCRPCIEEIPNVQAAYEKYHDKGFEIVSVGVDFGQPDEVANLKKLVESKKISWTVLSDELTVKAKLTSIAEYYSVNAIPDMFLVDKEGKVVELEARGPKLLQGLDKLLK